jgi:hypothetical protein
MTTHQPSVLQIAREWIRTDLHGCLADIARLGIEDAAEYQIDLAMDRAASGDDRWDGLTVEALREALEEVAPTYPRGVAAEVSTRRPDLASGDAIAAVLSEDPALSADEVIALLDEATEGHAEEEVRYNCHGCGEIVPSRDATWHGGECYCIGCEEAEPDEEEVR